MGHLYVNLRSVHAMAQQHPLQKLRSPSRTFSLLLHVLGVASFSYNFHFLTVWETPFDLAYGWHFQFLTILGLSAALLSFSFGILADLTCASVTMGGIRIPFSGCSTRRRERFSSRSRPSCRQSPA